jgi:hypothetical protein
MKGRKFAELFLIIFFICNIAILIPVIIRKPPVKDWLIVYFFNAATNFIADSFLSAHKIVNYPVRFLPKVFKTHILFDFLIYPTFSIIYNQMTERDRPFAIFYKLVLFSFPMFMIEFWAERRTSLIEWRKGWKWYHTVSSVIVKSLLTRSFIGLIRRKDRM